MGEKKSADRLISTDKTEVSVVSHFQWRHRFNFPGSLHATFTHRRPGAWRTAQRNQRLPTMDQIPGTGEKTTQPPSIAKPS